MQTERIESPGSRWYHRGLAFLSRARTSNGLISLADQVVASATNFLTGIIIARNCSKDEFGLYMLCFSIVLFVLDLQTSLISSPYMVYSPQFKDKRHGAYLGSTLIQQFLLTLLVLFPLGLGVVIASHGLGPEGMQSLLMGLSLVIWFIMFREFIRRICFASFEMGTAFLVDCTVALVQLSCLLFLAFQGLLSARFAFYAIGFACSLPCLAWLFSKRNNYTFQKKYIWSDCKKNISFGKWVFGSSLLWALSMSLYPWMLAYFHGTASTGVWAACWGVIAIANPLLLGIQNFLGPKIVQSYIQDGYVGLNRFVRRVSLLYIVIIMPLAIILFIFGGRLVALFYGQQYSGNGVVVSILTINLLVMAASFTLSRALLALEQARAYFFANIVPLLAMLSCGIYLVKKLAVTGVALGLLTGLVSTASIMSIFFIRLMKIHTGTITENG